MATFRKLVLFGAYTAFSLPSLAQQFPAYPIPFDYPGMSVACKTALNTTVQCHPLLPKVAPKLPRLNLQDLSVICTSTCLTSLQTVRAKIVQACTTLDIMTVKKVEYPATYLVDYLIYAHSLMCRRDPATQKYCDVLIMEWINEGTQGKACSDCALGAGKIQLNSPFGYDKNGAVAFKSLTSSCSKTGYAVTSPPPYALSTSTTSASASGPTYPSSCVTLVTSSAGDTCNGIAALRNVSSFAVYGPNGIRDCKKILVGRKLCLQGQCKRYQVKDGDTCQSILEANKVSVDAEVFVAWNPNIRSDCMNIGDLVGEWICLSYSEGLSIPTLSEDYKNNTVVAWPPRPTSTTPIPLPTASGTVSGCVELRNFQAIPLIQDQYYSPTEQPLSSILNECFYVARVHDISIEILLQWNPSLVSPTGCALAPGLSYCVDHPNKSVSSSTISSTSSTVSGMSSSSSTGIGSSQSSSGISSATTTSPISSSRTSSTLSSPSSSTRTTSSASPSTTAPGSVCILGTGLGNYEGLCSYCCHYGFCPPGPCTCSTYGQQVPVPDATFPIGYPAPGLDASYTSLCAFSCLRGYCPPGACTYTAP